MIATEAINKTLSEIDHHIGSFDKKSVFWRRADLPLSGLQALFTVATTICAGWEVLGSKTDLKNATLAFSALATLMTLLVARFGTRQRWLAYTQSSSQLKALKSRIQLYQSLPQEEQERRLSSDDAISLHEEMEKILNATNAQWEQLVASGDVRASGKAK